MDKYEIVDMFEQNFMTRCEGEAGVKSLENVCERSVLNPCENRFSTFDIIA